MRYVIALLVMCSPPMLLHADVADQAPNGFTVKISAVIHAAPEEVYSRLLHNVGDWWSSDHTFSQDAHNLSIDGRPMGCFCEKLPNNGGVRHGEVIMTMPNKMLVISATLGPLQSLGAAGTMTFVLEPVQKDTRLQFTYAVGGYVPNGLNTWAAPVDKVLTEQLTRLRTYIETGSPTVPSASKP